MINNKILVTYLNEYLNITKFSDYCPNGLQIEGKSDVSKIIAGVSANQDLIERAIDEKADALFLEKRKSSDYWH